MPAAVRTWVRKAENSKDDCGLSKNWSLILARMLMGVRLKRAPEGARWRHRRNVIKLLWDFQSVRYLMDRSQACRKKFCLCWKMLFRSDGEQGDESDKNNDK